MVVDALDLCYTKAHVDTFVIISGDSDFSPLVSKLRENNKAVIGVGVKQSSSDLLISNCDEFIYYDDLVREEKAKAKRAPRRKPQPKAAAKAAPAEDDIKTGEEVKPLDEIKLEEDAKPEHEDKTVQAIDLVMSTLDALVAERGEDEKIWGSMIKQTLKRRHPGFNESYYGFKSFNSLLEQAHAKGMLSLERDEKSGGYIVRPVLPEAAVEG